MLISSDRTILEKTEIKVTMRKRGFNLICFGIHFGMIVCFFVLLFYSYFIFVIFNSCINWMYQTESSLRRAFYEEYTRIMNIATIVFLPLYFFILNSFLSGINSIIFVYIVR